MYLKNGFIATACHLRHFHNHTLSVLFNDSYIICCTYCIPLKDYSVQKQ